MRMTNLWKSHNLFLFLVYSIQLVSLWSSSLALNEEIRGAVLGIVPELFNEDDDSNLNFYSGDSISEMKSICEEKTTISCEDCALTAINSRMLSKYNRTGGKIPCDELAKYNFHKLRITQKNVIDKSNLIGQSIFAIIIFSLYIACVLVGIGLCLVQHFRFTTLWNKLEIDAGNGMRSFRYERMKFKFDYNDPGAMPETGENYDDWILYKSSDDEDSDTNVNNAATTNTNVKPLKSGKSIKKSFTFFGGKAKAALQKKKMEERMRNEIARAKTWPWERSGYNFAKILYREGLLKDMQDWREDEESNFTSNI